MSTTVFYATGALIMLTYFALLWVLIWGLWTLLDFLERKVLSRPRITFLIALCVVVYTAWAWHHALINGF